MNLKKLILPVLPLLTAGCAIAPGMTMSSVTGGTATEPAVETVPGLGKVNIFEISPELISRLRIRSEHESIDWRLPPRADYQPYKIGQGDVLAVTFWEHPELTSATGVRGPFAEPPAGSSGGPSSDYLLNQSYPDTSDEVVDADGYVYYPYVGRVHIAGLTVEEVRELFTQRLNRYFKRPQIALQIAAYRSKRVNVVGEVARPGVQEIDDIPLTVAEAISRCGGLTAQADMQHVTLTRRGKTYSLDLLALYEQGSAAQNILLQNGDVLYVPNVIDTRVFVMGEVMKPQAVPMLRGRTTLADAIAESGGVDQMTASGARIYVIRRGEHGVPTIFHLNASNAGAMLLAVAFDLQPRDVVFVDTAKVARWGRVFNEILPSALIVESSRIAANP